MTGGRSGAAVEAATTMRVLITDHGAIADGSTLATAAIRAAIAAVSAAGGGEVVVPPGVFLTGMVRLRDRVHLHLAPGAVLKASPKPDDHLPLAETGGTGDHWRTGQGAFHLVVADGCRDVAITGSGTLDGNGTTWYPKPASELSWPLAHHQDWRRMGALVQIHASRDVRIEGVTLTNVGNWTLHLHESDRIQVRGVHISNPNTAPNADGIDITGCRNVTVSDCFIDTCDDAICLKTLPKGRSCEDVAVTNCILRTHCVALKLGCIESHGDMRNVVFSNCVVRGSHRAIGLYSLEGGILENIAVENIVCDTRAPLMFTRPIHIDLRRYRPESRLGAIRNVRIAGLIAETNGRCLLTALPGSFLEDIQLRDIVLRYPTIDDPRLASEGVGGSQFSNATPWARVERAAVIAENVRNLRIDDVQVQWPADALTTPADWRFPDGKIANGTHRLFTPPDWTHTAQPAFSAVSVRNVQGGRLDAYALTASSSGVPAVRSEGSTWQIRGA